MVRVNRAIAHTQDRIETGTVNFDQVVTDTQNPEHKHITKFQPGFTLLRSGHRHHQTVHIRNVGHNSPAHRAGIQVGQRIMAVNGKGTPTAIDPTPGGRPDEWVQKQMSAAAHVQLTLATTQGAPKTTSSY